MVNGGSASRRTIFVPWDDLKRKVGGDVVVGGGGGRPSLTPVARPTDSDGGDRKENHEREEATVVYVDPLAQAIKEEFSLDEYKNKPPKVGAIDRVLAQRERELEEWKGRTFAEKQKWEREMTHEDNEIIKEGGFWTKELSDELREIANAEYPDDEDGNKAGDAVHAFIIGKKHEFLERKRNERFKVDQDEWNKVREESAYDLQSLLRVYELEHEHRKQELAEKKRIMKVDEDRVELKEKMKEGVVKQEYLELKRELEDLEMDPMRSSGGKEEDPPVEDLKRELEEKQRELKEQKQELKKKEQLIREKERELKKLSPFQQTSDIRAYQHTYNSIFQPRLEEYDMMKFDPYSFSGAPLGGWGRATRSRLASLPIRLVSDLEGGMDLLFGDLSADEAVEESENEGGAVNEEDQDKDQQPGDGDGESQAEGDLESKVGDPPKTKKGAHVVPGDIKRSTGPHFTVHDATGQRYVCRVYAEEELVVMSRLDSVFHPAVTVWDEESAVERDYIADGQEDESQVKKGGGDGAHIKKKFQFSINGGGGGSVNDGDSDGLPEGIRSSVAKMLRKMGMTDAANALAGQQRIGGGVANNNQGGGGNVEVDVDMDVRVIDIDGNVMDNRIADIVKAAAIGASHHKKMDNDGPGSGNNGKDNINEKKQIGTSPSNPRLTEKEMFDLLNRLDGTCSQLHLGWWSYEWCHNDMVRQFHVAVSADPAKSSSYDIQDVTLVGKFGGKMSIIRPKGIYDGEVMEGTTTVVQMNRSGNVHEKETSRHTPKEDAQYSAVEFLKGSDEHVKLKKFKEKRRLGHGGPIVHQEFADGDFCKETGAHRRMDVEFRCCTDDEIDRWLESKAQRATTQIDNNKKDKKASPTPRAVLVSVQEDATCAYRSRVCTPLLCPTPPAEETPLTVSDAVADKAKAEAEARRMQNIREQQKTDPIGALLAAILGDEEDAVDHAGQVQVFFPDDVTGQQFEDLIERAEAGMDFMDHPGFLKVRDALREARDGGGGGGGVLSKNLDLKDLLKDGDAIASSFQSNSAMEVREGESIREILDKTLGKRPCLLKNLGWWTYEFCHTKQIRQYHANNLVDATTGLAKQKIETEHLLGIYEGGGNGLEDYPNSDEYKHVFNATDSASSSASNRKGANNQAASAGSKNDRGGNGAVYVQEYKHGDVCDHADVAESVIKGGNVVHGSVERASRVRFSCGKRWELIDIKEDSTCHYVLDVTVPELCQHALFKAPVTKTQVVKCLPV